MMITVAFTAEEARAVVDVIVAWGADDCPVGAIDTEELRIANNKLTTAIDAKSVKAA